MKRVINIIYGIFNVDIRVDLMLWLPCLAYYVWINYLYLQSILTRDSIGGPSINSTHELQLAILLYSQLTALFLFILVIDGLFFKIKSQVWRIGFVFVAHIAFASFYIDFTLYKLMSIHLMQGISMICIGGISRIPLNWAHTGISNEVLRNYLLWGSATVAALFIYSKFAVTRSSFKVNWFSAVSLLTVVLYALLISEIMTCGVGKQFGAFSDLTSTMPIYFGRGMTVRGKELFVPRLVRVRSERNLKAVHEMAESVSRPDIFIFVLESARGDFVTPEIMPNLNRFSLECLSFPDAISSGNASHISWYSLLTGNFPVYYGIERSTEPHEGSAPIELLRTVGYKVNVMCSSTLDYYGIDQIAFGDNLKNCDSMFDAEKEGGPDAPTRDLRVNRKVLDYLDAPPGNRLFLIFYHSSHHNYDWPTEEPAPFVPYVLKWKYNDFRIDRERLNLIQNRYRNSLHFQDRLIGEVFSKLKSNGQFNNSIIFAVGDHGEEFLEHGKLLHASNLFRPQTHVPFLVRFPTGTNTPTISNAQLPVATHVDLFPSLLDFLQIHTTNVFDGESFFRKTNDYVIVAAQNGSKDPFKFCIQSGNRKAFFEYASGSRRTASQRAVYLTKFTDAQDRPIQMDLNGPEGQAIRAGFRKLYSGIDLIKK